MGRLCYIILVKGNDRDEVPESEKEKKKMRALLLLSTPPTNKNLEILLDKTEYWCYNKRVKEIRATSPHKERLGVYYDEDDLCYGYRQCNRSVLSGWTG